MQPVFRFLVGVILVLAGCVDTPSESTKRSGVVTENRVTANRVTANRVTANHIAASKIAAERITEDRLTVSGAAAELIATEDGREVFFVLVNCALRKGTTLVGTVDGVEYQFPGDLGLAPGWIHHPLDEKDKGWVSACVFSRINEEGISVDISIRGPNSALKVTDEERAEFSLEEGAFFGKLFTPPDEPILWFACRGRDQAAGESGDLVNRHCAEPDPARPGLTKCGFFFAGDCADFTGTGEAACEQFFEHGQFYRRCQAGSINTKGDPDRQDDAQDGDHSLRVFRQVITSFVRA
jgi:hypothetical protein